MIRAAFLLAFLTCTVLLLAQEPTLVVYGTVRDFATRDSIPFPTVQIQQIGSDLPLSPVVPTARGRYHLELGQQGMFRIFFGAPGKASKSVQIDTHGPTRAEWDGGFGMNIDVVLMDSLPGLDYSILREPFGKSEWDKVENRFAWDIAYTKGQASGMEALVKAFHASSRSTVGIPKPYTIGDYLQDRRIGYRADSAYNAGDIAGALQIHRTITGHSPWTHFWRAKLIWETGGSPDAELAEAFNRGFRYSPSQPPDSFDVAYASRLKELEAQTATKRDTQRIQRCEKLIARDQELANDLPYDLLGNRTNLETLDALIREGGWPSSYSLSGSGVDIVLAHQEWDQAYQFQPYQALIEQECRAGRESWSVALAVLQQRIRYTARNKTDTIDFADVTLADDDPALPMLVAISERLAANGHKHLWIHAADSLIAQAIADRIMLEQPKNTTPPDVLEFLKSKGMDGPGAVTPMRITWVIDPALPRNRSLYRMT